MVQTPTKAQDLYPDSDGQPIAENTLQYQWIVRLVENLKCLFKGQNVFVAGDLLWYPIQVKDPPAPSQAPDAMVVFGRPEGDRGSYKQWQEGNIAPQVVFEILSPSNTASEMAAKQSFYAQYGVLEMYFYNPESFDFWGLVRESQAANFKPVMALNLPWVSPLLQIRFELCEDGLEVFYPSGEPFKTLTEIAKDLEQTRSRLNQAQFQLNQTQSQRDKAFAKLKELGIDPDTL